MASTNKTTHYELPQWIGTDKPTFLGDMNQAYEDIDTAIYNAATAASNAASAAGSAQSAASTAQSAAESAASTASAANTLATTANTNAVSALNAIGSTPLQTQAQTLTAAVNEVLHDVPDDATDIPYDNQTSGLTATTVQGAIDEIAQGGSTGFSAPDYANISSDTDTTITGVGLENAHTLLTASEDCYIRISTSFTATPGSAQVAIWINNASVTAFFGTNANTTYGSAVIFPLKAGDVVKASIGGAVTNAHTYHATIPVR